MPRRRFSPAFRPAASSVLDYRVDRLTVAPRAEAWIESVGKVGAASYFSKRGAKYS